MPKSIYIASRFERQKEMKRWAEVLGRKFKVTASWIHSDKAESSLPDDQKQLAAMQCLDDIAESDVVVIYNPPEDASEGHGGRHCEFFAGWYDGLDIYIVGAKSNIFHYLPNVRLIESGDPEVVESVLVKRYRL